MNIMGLIAATLMGTFTCGVVLFFIHFWPVMPLFAVIFSGLLVVISVGFTGVATCWAFNIDVDHLV